MCGIAGVLESGVTAGQWEEQLRAMNEALVHRGPDDAGILFDADACLLYTSPSPRDLSTSRMPSSA